MITSKLTSSELELAANHFIELYADEIKGSEGITGDAIYVWWGQTKDQYSDDINYEELEKLIKSKIS